MTKPQDTPLTRPVACIACSILKNEIETLQARGEIDLPVRYVESMLHIHPVLLRKRLQQLLPEESNRSHKILLIYGDCHSHMIDMETQPGIARLQAANCAEMLLGRKEYQRLLREGVFFLMPEWTLRWREIMREGLGLSGETAKAFMNDMHTSLLYLDTGVIPVPHEELQAASEALGLPYETRPVPLDRLAQDIRTATERLSDDNPARPPAR